jgi:hypothetical protein
MRAHLRFYVRRAEHHVESKRRLELPSFAEHDIRHASLSFRHADGNQIFDQKLAYALHAEAEREEAVGAARLDAR